MITATELAALAEAGPVEILGRMRFSSNNTFLLELGRAPNSQVRGIYKPEAGEQPLWDFPPGLWRREIATYVVSERLGLELVPPTIAMPKGPFGPGSLQLFIEARFEEHAFTILDSGVADTRLRELCAMDVIVNSADRKAGHCLIDRQDRLWAIDNGLTFHVLPKLRTVLWDFSGEPLLQQITEALMSLLDSGAPTELGELLDPDEISAMMQRAEQLLELGRFPSDPGGRSYPWPLI